MEAALLTFALSSTSPRNNLSPPLLPAAVTSHLLMRRLFIFTVLAVVMETVGAVNSQGHRGLYL